MILQLTHACALFNHASMDPKNAINARIAQLRHELERLEAAAAILDDAAPSAPLILPATLPAPRTREQILAELVREAGVGGTTARELYRQISAVSTKSTRHSTASMLTRLRRAGVIRNVKGRWFAA